MDDNENLLIIKNKQQWNYNTSKTLENLTFDILVQLTIEDHESKLPSQKDFSRIRINQFIYLTIIVLVI